jgi:hypothetical protein
VLAAYVNRNLLSADGWDDNPDAPNGGRQVAVALSTDAGETFALTEVDPVEGNFTDPVIRVTEDGSFWLVRLRIPEYTCAIHRSTDGLTWSSGADIPCGDKPWLAVENTAAWVASQAGFARVPADGSSNTFAMETGFGSAIAGSATTVGTSMLHLLQNGTYYLERWDGLMATAEVQIADLAGGPGRDFIFGMFSAATGHTMGGQDWIVRTVFMGETPTVVLWVGDDTGGSEILVSAPGEMGFFPAATLAADGRLHVIWYDTSGQTGALLYVRSRSSDLLEGFDPASIIDREALPGGSWYPSLDEIRRLREYIDITTDGARAHLAWTRAVEPPSRVYTTWVESLAP